MRYAGARIRLAWRGRLYLQERRECSPAETIQATGEGGKVVVCSPVRAARRFASASAERNATRSPCGGKGLVSPILYGRRRGWRAYSFALAPASAARPR